MMLCIPVPVVKESQITKAEKTFSVGPAKAQGEAGEPRHLASQWLCWDPRSYLLPLRSQLCVTVIPLYPFKVK